MPYTRLSLTATPGRRYSFSAKTTGTHAGLFTELTILALPGMRRVFVAKSEEAADTGGGRFYPKLDRFRLARGDDEDMMDILYILIGSGALN